MARLSGTLIAAALIYSFGFAGTAHSQNCGRIESIIEPCGSCSVEVNSCRTIEEFNTCTYVFPGIACPCAENEYVGTANTSGTCDSLVQPTEPAKFNTVAKGLSTFVVYIPNCAGSYSIERVRTG